MSGPAATVLGRRNSTASGSVSTIAGGSTRNATGGGEVLGDGQPDVHWARFSGDGKLIAASEQPSSYFALGAAGYNYVAFSGVDMNKCAASVTMGMGSTF
jgi:hypothetical protein